MDQGLYSQIKQNRARLRSISYKPSTSDRVTYKKSFYTTKGDPMSLVKTAQLNVYELLKYLDHEKLEQELQT